MLDDPTKIPRSQIWILFHEAKLELLQKQLGQTEDAAKRNEIRVDINDHEKLLNHWKTFAIKHRADDEL
jgi:hypothetical protein